MDVIDVQVAVCRYSIFQAGFLAAHVYKLLAVWRPGERLHTTERLHGCFKRLIRHDILYTAYFRPVEITDERVGDFSHPFIPVLIHKVIHHTARSLWQVGIYILCRTRILHIGDENHLLAVRREQESAHTVLHIRHLHPRRAVCRHYPHLGLAVGVRVKKRDSLTVLYPHSAALTFCSRSDACSCRIIQILHIQVQVTPVFLHTLIRDAEKHLLLVRRQRWCRHTAQSLKGVNVKNSGLGMEIRFVNDVPILALCLRTGRSPYQRQGSRSHSYRFKNTHIII